MVTKELQTLNFKFDQVTFNSLVLTWERNFEVTFGIFSVLVFQINVLESYSDISYDKKCENCHNLGLQIKVLPIFRLYQQILQRFVSLCISLIFTYCLFVEKNW